MASSDEELVQDEVSDDEVIGIPPLPRSPGKRTVAKSARQRGAGRPSKVQAGKKSCLNCGKVKSLEEFPPGSANCRDPCKRIIDNLRSSFERARKKDVFDDMMKDETARKKLIRAYIMKCGVPKGMRGGKKKKEAGFCALQFLQEVRVEEQLVRDGVYEMMHEVAFMSHAAKPKHYPPTGLDQESAKSEFLKLSRETNAIVDFLGPTQKYQMRVGIKVKTLVTHRSLTAKAQAYQLKDKEKKKATQAEVNAAYNRLYKDMAEVGGATNALSNIDVLKNLASASDRDGGAFDGDQFSLTDIGSVMEYMAKNDARHGEEEEEVAGGENEEEDDDNDAMTEGSSRTATGTGRGKSTKRQASIVSAEGSPVEKKLKKVWFDRDSKIADAMRKQEQWLCNIEKSLANVSTELTDCLSGIPDAMKAKLSSEIRIARTRVEGVALVLAKPPQPGQSTGQADEAAAIVPGAEAAAPATPGAPAADAPKDLSASTEDPTEVPSWQKTARDALGKYIASFAGSSGAVKAGDLEAARQRLGSAPPCSSYRYLKCIFEFQRMVNDLLFANTPDDIKASINRMEPWKHALSELLTMSKQAVRKLKSGVSTITKENERASKRVIASLGNAAAPANNSDLFEHAPTLGQNIPCKEFSAFPATEMDWKKPGIIALPDKLEMFNKEGVVALAMKSFMNKFAASDQRATEGRAQRPLKSDSAKVVQELIAKIVPEDLIIKLDTVKDESSVKILAPSTYGIVHGQETATAESGYTAALRLSWQGTRTIVCARLEHVLNFLEAAGEPKASVSPKRAYQFLRSADKDILTKFSNNAPEKIMHGTVGAMDVFYLPSGWVFTERVGRGADAFGIRVSVLMKSDKDVLESISEWLLSVSKPSQVLQHIMDSMVLGCE